MKMRLRGYLLIILVCFFYWILDSAWSFLSFEVNLKNLIFSEPVSWIDTFLLRVPPYQVVARLMAVALFAATGSIILEFFIRKQKAVKARKEAYDTLRIVLNSIDATIYVADFDTYEILFMNQKMIDLFGGDFIGRRCHEVFQNSSDHCKTCRNDQLLDKSGNPADVITWEGQNPILEASYIYHDRAIRWVDGRIVHLQIASDISQLKQLQQKQLVAEARLQQAQKMESLGNLTGGIAHDFNNILSPIIGMSELLMEDLPNKSSEFEMANEIFRAGIRGRDLVNQILTFSRQDGIIKTPAKIQQILKEVLNLLRATIPSNIEIHENIHPDCGLVEADPTQIHQVAMNLITNAYHAAEQNNGSIIVDLQEKALVADDLPDSPLKPGRYVVWTISDTGCGIDPEIIGRIFDPYFTTKEQGKGTGLGLSVVYGIVRKHDGDIKVYSELGKGTSFSVYLPVMGKYTPSKVKEMVQATPTGDERILLVDDEEAIVKFEKKLLERLGYKVITHVSSVEALEAFKATPEAFDLVITDMTMPNLTGDLLAKELKSIKPDIPVIVSTGFSERINEKSAEAYGIDGLLMKPVAISALAQMIRRVLD